MIMKKDVQLKFALLLMLFVASFAACDDDDEKIDAGSPDFTFNSETGEYNVRIGKRVSSLRSCERCRESSIYLETGGKNRGGRYGVLFQGGDFG